MHWLAGEVVIPDGLAWAVVAVSLTGLMSFGAWLLLQVKSMSETQAKTSAVLDSLLSSTQSLERRVEYLEHQHGEK